MGFSNFLIYLTWILNFKNINFFLVIKNLGLPSILQFTNLVYSLWLSALCNEKEVQNIQKSPLSLCIL
jgi:hypothetical protein